MSDKTAYRGVLFYFKETATLANLPINKDKQSDKDCQYVYIEDGVLIVESGKVVEAGSYADLKSKLTYVNIINYKDKLITPGFIDTHHAR
jgi:guanine deaminase